VAFLTQQAMDGNLCVVRRPVREAFVQVQYRPHQAARRRSLYGAVAGE